MSHGNEYTSLFPRIHVHNGKLWEGNQEFRFFGFALPNLHQNENQVHPDYSNRFPDEFEIRDLLFSLKQMECKVARLFCLSVSSPLDGGMPVYINGVGQYNEEAFRTLDKIFHLAREYGIRLIIPFIDSHSFVGWRGVDEWTAWKNRDGVEFWTEPVFKTEFKDLVYDVLHRRNSYTGILYKDDPAVLAWQLGNELDSYFSDRKLDNQQWMPVLTQWSIEMARYIKTIAPDILVMEAGGLRDVYLDEPAIDIVSDHYYEYWSKLAGRAWNLANQNRYSRQQNAGRKPLIADEFGMGSFENLSDLMDEIIYNGTSGALLWSLRGHRRDGGFYYHNENGSHYNAYHWPGFTVGESYDERPLLALLRKKAFEIQELPETALQPPLNRPQWILTESATTLNWCGVTGATHYIVERADTPNGIWITIGYCVEDAIVEDVKRYEDSGESKPLPLFEDISLDTADSTGQNQVYFYRICAENSAGIGPWSEVLKRQL